MIVKPRIRGFVCITAHPKGCAAKVREEIKIAQSKKKDGPQKVLVIGSSTGYGLSSRITAAFRYEAATFGVFFERPSAKGKPASAGWYNSVAFEKAAHEAGLYAKSINGDAFSKEVKDQTIAQIKADLGQVDLVVYSLASPRRTDPVSGETYKSVLKPTGDKPFVNQTLDTDRNEIKNVEIEPATEEEIEHTVKVMGGEDWELWMKALHDAGVLAVGAKSVAYSYIGPEVTWPIYKNGTIGQAKKDVERAAAAISKAYDCKAYVAVNKAVVTQASSAIPVVPLYISILFKLMKTAGTHEDCIEQMVRLFDENLYSEKIKLDEDGRIRIDDLEMQPEIQQEVISIWNKITTENLNTMSDYAGYQKNFLNLFGFKISGVDYEEDVEVDLPLPGSLSDLDFS